MASYNIHIAVGKRYLEKNHNITNASDFYLGLIDPDLTLDKRITHYSDPDFNPRLFTHTAKKVSLYAFLSQNTITSDYEKGIFLHLITDYLFFNMFLDKDYLKNISYEDFCYDLYYSYKSIDDYLLTKYHIDYSIYPKNVISKMNATLKTVNKKDVKNIIPESKLDAFIEYVSDINLYSYAHKIILNKKNIIP